MDHKTEVREFLASRRARLTPRCSWTTRSGHTSSTSPAPRTPECDRPVVGPIELSFEVFGLPADDGLSILTCSAEPGSASEDALKLLASGAATRREPDHVTAEEYGATPVDERA